MPVSSFDDAGAFHRAMRRLAATKVGRTLFRPTAHRLDQVLSKVTAGSTALPVSQPACRR